MIELSCDECKKKVEELYLLHLGYRLSYSYLDEGIWTKEICKVCLNKILKSNKKKVLK